MDLHKFLNDFSSFPEGWTQEYRLFNVVLGPEEGTLDSVVSTITLACHLTTMTKIRHVPVLALCRKRLQLKNGSCRLLDTGRNRVKGPHLYRRPCAVGTMG